MKKVLLFALVLGFAYSAIAQEQYKRISTHLPHQSIAVEAPTNTGSDLPGKVQQEDHQATINGRDITFISIGKAGNAYGFYNSPRTYLWADPWVNSVVFTHRMLGGTELEGNSRVAYDLSTDGGDTWTTDIQIYTPTGPDPGTGYPQDAGRYPQGAIINDVTNSDPANAYYSYWICALDNSNGDAWGGHAYGSNVLTEIDPPDPSQVNLTSEGDVLRYVPDSYHATQQAEAWYAEPTSDLSGGTPAYTGNLLVGHGMMNDDDEIEFEEDLFPFLAAGDGINDNKIAFGDDGQVGYILVMTDAVSDPVPYTSYHPVLLKTEDGGESWSDPMHVQLGGEDGIESLQNYFTDEAILGAGYPEGFDREEVYYNMGFQVDLIVDQDDNPYITVIIAIGDEDGWYPNETQMATWNLYSEDGGMTWDADPLYDNLWLQADIGGVVQYNRPYASRSYDGHYLFFSWLDSEIDVATQNDRPNIYVVGYDVEDNRYSEVFNVTYFTQAWNQAFYGSQSYYVFGGFEPMDDMYTFEIPFVYTEFTVPGDDTAPMDFWYVDGFTLDMPVNTPELEANAIDFSVGQNFPNPASTSTQILVTAQTELPIDLTVSNLLGQTVYTDRVDTRALAHTFNVNVSDLTPGIYMYTVTIGDNAVTKKMLVE
jgi:hypothetical protein